MNRETTLQREIEKLTERTTPMHMPGHKRKSMPSDCLPYEYDITEIEGADDLHDARGILREAMDRAASLWGSKRTWFLVGGSTCGVLAAIRAAAPFGSEIIAARNCHRSVYHAIELGGYKVHWIMPAQNREFEICLGITASQVNQTLRKHPRSTAVILTSPTYEGIVSEIRAISSICHRAEIPLIVDEAHGAHLGLFESGGFPEGAVSCGADIAVQSVHKTLSSLTQTALLHFQGDLISEKEIERQLGIFETSSPSYPLMISIDSCVHLLREQGQELFAQWKYSLDRFYEGVNGFVRIKVLSDDAFRGESGKKVVRDRSKILINFSRAGLTGAKAAKILRKLYGIETEMSSGMNVLAMTGTGDSEESLKRLYRALMDLDDRLREEGEPPLGERRVPASLPAVQTACRILDAVNSPVEEVPITECEGRICGEYLYAYPPGVPVLAPGEYIRSGHLQMIGRKNADGNRIRHTHTDSPDAIVCLAE